MPLRLTLQHKHRALGVQQPFCLELMQQHRQAAFSIIGKLHSASHAGMGSLAMGVLAIGSLAAGSLATGSRTVALMQLINPAHICCAASKAQPWSVTAMQSSIVHLSLRRCKRRLKSTCKQTSDAASKPSASELSQSGHLLKGAKQLSGRGDFHKDSSWHSDHALGILLDLQPGLPHLRTYKLE